MPTKLENSLKEAHLSVTKAVKAGKPLEDVLKTPALVRLKSQIGKGGSGPKSDINIACDSGCLGTMDKASRIARPTK